MKYHTDQICSQNLKGTKYLVVGSGFFGAVIAERIANDLNQKVIVIDKRNHIGGNSYSETDKTSGIECHIYGSHIFHTNNEIVWQYINRFCSFNSYRHKVLTKLNGKVYQMPINLETINSFYGLNMSPREAKLFLKKETSKEQICDPSNLEEKAISLIGRPLYEGFIKGYTLKQWGVDPKKLPTDIITRLPVRFNFKADYFNDPWQGIPLKGYQSIFNRMLNYPNIQVYLRTDYNDIRHLIPEDCCIIFSGPIDRYFNYKFGKLGWRTLKFEKEVMPIEDFQGTSVINYADESIPYTRIHEFRHYHEERHYPDDKTVIFREFSCDINYADDPYYPINTDKDKLMLKLYEDESRKHQNAVFGGRLGSYAYLDMDRTIALALQAYNDKIKSRI
jgi:UDP-galactopyranose mutase